MREMNKKGQQMTLGTIIAIVLGIAVLVFLIFGFSTGWNNLWDKVGNIGGGKANVDAVVQGCAVACSSQSVDAFCRQGREIKYGDGISVKGSWQTFLNEKSIVNVAIGDCSIDCTPVTVPPLTGDNIEKINAAQKVVDDKGSAATDDEKTALSDAKKNLADAKKAK